MSCDFEVGRNVSCEESAVSPIVVYQYFSLQVRDICGDYCRGVSNQGSYFESAS